MIRAVVVLVALVAVFAHGTRALDTTDATALPMISVEGTYKEVGAQIGKAFAARIADFIGTFEPLQKYYLPFVNTPTGRAVYNAYLETQMMAYPEYMDEIEGVAAGVASPEVTFQALFTMNLQDELALILVSAANDPNTAPDVLEIARAFVASPFVRIEACSDVHRRFEGSAAILAHNEDNVPIIGAHAFMVTARIYSGSSSAIAEEWTAYFYPGMVAGIAFGFFNTPSGNVGISCNAVFPDTLHVGGLANAFLSRSVLGAKSFDDAVARASGQGAHAAGVRISYGLSVNLVDFATGTLVNVESSDNATNTLEITDTSGAGGLLQEGVFFHFNMYRHLSGVDEITDTSSVHRMARAQQILAADHGTLANLTAITAVLGDTKDPEYPIYRDAAPPDTFATLATAVFDVVANEVLVWVAANPKLGPPALRFPLFSSPLSALPLAGK